MPQSKDALHRAAFFALLVGITLFFLWLVRGLLFPVFWAVVFAILLHPLYQGLLRFARFRSVAALLSIAIALVIVLVPIATIGAGALQETQHLYGDLVASGALAAAIQAPEVADFLEFLRLDPSLINARVAAAAEAGSSWLLSQTLAISGATASFFLQLAVMLYLLFFLLRDGERVVAYLKRRLPFEDSLDEKLFARFAVTTRATVKGTVVISLLQGLAGGLIFLAAGMPNPLLWGVVMTLLAFLPLVGPSLVWLPTSIFLLATGAYVPGAIVLAGGLLVVGPIDTFIRPILVGKDTRLPGALVLLSILGGIAAFGLAGIIIGPIAAALMLVSWDMFAESQERAA